MPTKKKITKKKKTTKKKVVKKRSSKKKIVKKKTIKKKTANKTNPSIGNEFWKMRSSHGRKPIFKSPEELQNACYEYFQWVIDTPLIEAKPFSYEGRIIMGNVPKMRAMTLEGLCIFLDIDRKTFDLYCAREDFIPITNHIRDIIYEQKFTGAAANLLNGNIIARDLGLREKTELTGKDGKPVSVGFYLPYNNRDPLPEKDEE